MQKRLIWLFLVVLFLAARYQNLPGVFTERGVEINDTDPYYRLQRIERIVKTAWTYPLQDPALSFPQGFRVPWPMGLDYVVALPLKLIGVQKRLTIEVFSALIIPILALPSLYFAVSVAESVAGPWVGLAVGALTAIAPTDIYASGVGRLDHHFLEGLLTIGALFLITRRKWVPLAFLLGFGPSFWPQGWVMGLFVAFSFFIRNQDSEGRREAPFIFFTASILSQIPLFFSDAFRSGLVTIFGFSWWSTLLYAAIGLFFMAQQSFSKRSLALTMKDRAFLFYFAGVAIFLTAKNGIELTSRTTHEALSALSASTGVLQSTSETISTFLLPVKAWPQLGLIPLVLAWVWFILQSFRRERWWLVGYMAGPLILCAMQARFIPLSSPIFILGSVLLLKDFSNRVVKYAEYQNIVFGLSALALAIPSVPRFQWSLSGNAHPLYLPVRDAALFLEARNRDMKLSPGERSIASHWDDGHWLLYYGKMPVVAHPFQSASAVDTLNLFVSEKTEDLDAFRKIYPIRYLLVETPTMRVNTWLALVGKRTSDFIKTVKQEDGTEIDTPLPRFNNLLSYRFFMQDGTQVDGNSYGDWRLVYVSPRSFFDRKGSPCLKVFEHVPGAIIQATSKEHELTLVGKINASDGNFYFHEQAKVLPGKKLQWLVPYSSVDAGGVKFDGKFFIDGPKSKRKDLALKVTEEDILKGRLIDLGTIRW